MITTVYQDQTDILMAISSLYLEGGKYTADLTYSTGEFWRHFPAPLIRMDIDPTSRANVIGNVEALPFKDNSLGSVVIDLPFIHAHGKDSVMGKRFNSFPSQKLLRHTYTLAILEAHQVLRPKTGILVFKCQDIVESGKQVWNHAYVLNCMEAYGFEVMDLFILARGRPPLVGHNHKIQKHARRTHSYFWVGRKIR